MGQSNCVGEGSPKSLNNTVFVKEKHQYLWDNATNDWAVSPNVRNVFNMASGGAAAKVEYFHNEFMTVNFTKRPAIGPELGIGWALGLEAPKVPIMSLKSCIGNRALGWDLLPPSSEAWNFTNPTTKAVTTYGGYHQQPEKAPVANPPKDFDPATGKGWYSGVQYDGDTFRAADIVANLSTYYPGASGYEIAGFFWWQGTRDSLDLGLSEHYETNLVKLIKDLRLSFKAPKAKFVTASLGQTVKGATTNDGLILDAMLNVDGSSGKYPDFKGNVAAVYAHPYSMGSSSGNHYGGNAQTYMNIGQAMGNAMNALLKEQ